MTGASVEAGAGDIDSVNHVGVAVRDIGLGADAFARLGFALTPLSMHSGALNPGEPIRPYGSGNRCAVFRRSYVEVLAHVRPELPDFFVRDFLSRFEGPHIICFGCADIDVLASRLDATGVANSGVIPLRRDVPAPPGAARPTATARFRVTHFERGATPEGLIQATQHLDPDLIHQPHHLRHPNGAVDLAEVVLCVDAADLAETARRYQRYLGREPEWDGDLASFALPVCRVVIAARQGMPARYGSPPPAVPGLVGFGVAVRDLSATRDLLAANGVRLRAAGGRLLAHAAGTTVCFEQEAAGDERRG